MADTDIELKIDNLRDPEDLAPLYFRYSREINAQKAFVELDEYGSGTADSDGEIGGAVSFHVYHHRTLRFPVASAVRGSALVAYLDSPEAQALLQRIHDGHSVEWDGNNNVGRITSDAAQAIDELATALEQLPTVEVVAAADWIQEDPCWETLWPADKKKVEEAATSLAKDALDNDLVIDGDLEDALLDKAQRAYNDEENLPPHVLAALKNDGRIKASRD